MEFLKSPTLCPVSPIPGLFISDRFAASSISNIKSHNIVRILSLVDPQEVPRFEGQAVEIKNIDIDDEPTVDILEHLQNACDWIQEGLDLDPRDGQQAGVLVHCRQGISRSGSFVVAYLMRKLQIPYPEALSLAEESRSLVCPNDGFHRQLQIWEQCKFNVYTPSSADNAKKEKPAYKAWKDERDDLVRAGEEAVNRARASAMANAVARFGKKRQEALDRRPKEGA
ncbi:hypothetical protein FQN54_001844 [Arachnomyces sp. PD_36]|nr:hypothetical protein FQN54_001844 [Arachnomyces sp. PD_36]